MLKFVLLLLLPGCNLKGKSGRRGRFTRAARSRQNRAVWGLVSMATCSNDITALIEQTSNSTSFFCLLIIVQRYSGLSNTNSITTCLAEARVVKVLAREAPSVTGRSCVTISRASLSQQSGDWLVVVGSSVFPALSTKKPVASSRLDI